MKKVLDLKNSEYRELISETARIMRVQPAIIEKDIWVCSVLQMLFSDPLLKYHLVFKGGTSLSKVYKLIHRFSEDIDLILDWRLFGYGERERDPYSPRRSKTRQDRFNKEINHAAAEYLRTTFVPHLKQLLSDRDDIDVRISDSDPNAVEIMYPSIYSADYIPSRVLLEIGPLAAWVPSKWQRITPYVAEVFPQATGRIDINVLSTTAERTFWEKATILHQEAHRIKAPLPRYSRHYYDLYMMARAPVKKSALADPELLRQVVEFKQRFYPSAWARYDLAAAGTFRLIPEANQLKEIERDYREMSIMIFDEAPEWDTIMHGLGALEEEINGKTHIKE